MVTRGQQIPHEKELEKKVIGAINSVSNELDLKDGTTLIHDGRRGYIVNPEGDIIGYKVKAGVKGGPDPWIDAEMRSNRTKGPGYAFGIYRKRPDRKN